jgi:hypothetical protein
MSETSRLESDETVSSEGVSVVEHIGVIGADRRGHENNAKPPPNGHRLQVGMRNDSNAAIDGCPCTLDVGKFCAERHDDPSRRVMKEGIEIWQAHFGSFSVVTRVLSAKNKSCDVVR